MSTPTNDAIFYSTLAFIWAGITYTGKFGRRALFQKLEEDRIKKFHGEKKRIIYDDPIYLALPLPIDLIYQRIRYKNLGLYT
jgi:hypothetical protein